MTLDATIGGNASNVYSTLAETDAYFANHLKFATWNDFTQVQKQRAKIMATLMIDREKFKQDKASIAPIGSDDFQRLEFPRIYCYDNDGELYIPEEIKMAEAEQALYLLEDMAESKDGEEEPPHLCQAAFDFLAPHLNRVAMIGRM